jgi:MFS family permease
VLGTLLQQTTARLRRKALTLPRPQLAAADILRIPAFRYFWASFGLTNLANQMRMMIVAWLVLDLTNSQLWVGLVNGLPGIAIAAFSLAGGVMVDRASPKALLVRVRLTVAVASFLMAFLVTAGVIQVWHLLLLTLLASGVNGIDIVASQVCFRSLVSRDRMLNAMALLRMASNLGNIVGPALGGVLLAWVGAPAALWALVVVFGLALVALSQFPRDTVAKREMKTSALRDLREGFHYAGRTQHVRWLLILGGILILPASFIPLMPSHVRDTLHAGPEALGFLMGIYGAGGLLGSVLLALRKDVSRKGLAMTAAALVWSIALAGLAFSHSFYLSAACLFLIGVLWSVWMNNMNTLLQTTVPMEKQGRVVSINKILSQGGMTWLVGGMLGAALGQAGTFLLAGGVFAVLSLVAYWRTPELRQPD